MPAPATSRTWKCTICGRVDAAAPAVRCPECGARREMFEPSDEPVHGAPHQPFQPRERRSPEVLGPREGGCIGEE